MAQPYPDKIFALNNMNGRGGIAVRFNNGKCHAYYHYYLILFLQTQ